MSHPALTYDPDVNALYIELLDTEVHGTLELAKGVYIDVHAEGEIVGIEALNADASLLASIPALPNKVALRDLLNPHEA
jgi:uncharacterized protein YuzE